MSDYRAAYATHAFRTYFACHLPETEAERLNHEAVKTVLGGLSDRKADLLRLVYSDGAETLQEAVKSAVCAYGGKIPEPEVWRLIRFATRKFAEARVL